MFLSISCRKRPNISSSNEWDKQQQQQNKKGTTKHIHKATASSRVSEGKIKEIQRRTFGNQRGDALKGRAFECTEIEREQCIHTITIIRLCSQLNVLWLCMRLFVGIDRWAEECVYLQLRTKRCAYSLTCLWLVVNLSDPFRMVCC